VKRKIEAWCAVASDGRISIGVSHDKEWVVDQLEPGDRLVRLVPYDAREKAVVRAAKALDARLGTDEPDMHDQLEALTRAVAKLNRPRKK
jgi:hypothetical protein